MRYNELVRPAGIGRKQVAFNTSVTPSELSIAEAMLNTEDTTAQFNDGMVSVAGLSEAAAYSAATSTETAVQNFCLEIDQVKNYSFYSDAPIQFGRLCVKTPFIDYDERSQQFYCRKPGWYFVKCFIHFDGVLGNYDWYMYLNTNKQVGANTYETYPQYMAYANVYKHCALNGTALYNVPVQSDTDNNANVRPFQIYLGTTHGGMNTLTNANTKLGLQIIYLGELFNSERVLYSV